MKNRKVIHEVMVVNKLQREQRQKESAKIKGECENHSSIFKKIILTLNLLIFMYRLTRSILDHDQYF